MHDLAIHSAAGFDADGAGGLFGLSLCSGAGGLDLGIMLAEPGYRAIGYVERDAFAAAVLVARMEDQTLDQAPVWNDITTFDGRPWRGVVDCLSGGYPCQPFSIAGQRRGTDDPRHLWPHIARIIEEVDPEWCFFENVANHLNIGYREVRGELEGLGFRVEEGLFTAAEVGAPHRRQRLFIMAHAGLQRRQSTVKPDPQGQPLRPPERQEGASWSRSGSENVADAKGMLGKAIQRLQPDGTDKSMGHTHGPRRFEPKRRGSPELGPDAPEQILVDANGAGLEIGQDGTRCIESQQPSPERAGDLPAFPPRPGDADEWERYLADRPDAQPCVRRGSDGLAYRVDRLRLCGNGVVPLVAAHAWRTLKRRFDTPGN